MTARKTVDAVNHPKHYTFGKIEVIDVIEDWSLGFHEGNAIKYVARAKHKGRELEDLKKSACFALAQILSWFSDPVARYRDWGEDSHQNCLPYYLFQPIPLIYLHSPTRKF